MPSRKRRSAQERLEAAERELEELRKQAKMEALEDALKSGNIPAEKRDEVAAQLRELRLIKKTIKVARRHGADALADSLIEFQDEITSFLSDLVAEGSPSPTL